MNQKLLIVHNILWSHYTGNTFKYLYEMYFKEGDGDFKVVHLANNMANRKSIGDTAEDIHTYPHEVLYDGNIEEIETFRAIKMLFSKMKRFKPKVVVIFGLENPIYWFVMLLTRLQGRKLVLVANTTFYDHKRVFIKEQFKRMLMKLPHGFMCYGRVHRSYLTSLGVASKKIKIRCQATDNEKIILAAQKYKSGERDQNIKDIGPFVLFVGRLIREKNLEKLLKAFYQSKVDKSLVIIGDGILKESLMTLTKELNIENKVFFLGPKLLEDIIPYYCEASAFILPSISETWGLVVNEAMLCGLPILVSKHCGCSKDLVVNGENGYVFDPHNIFEISTILSTISNNEEKLKIMGFKSRELIKDFNPERAAKQFFESIESVC